MTTPLAPDKPTIDTFGAPYSDPDAVVDPETEMASEYMNRLIAQVSMLSMTAPIAWVRCAVDIGTVTVTDHSAVWGDTSAVKPTVAYTGTGDYLVTWAAAYDDLQATPESHTTSIRSAQLTLSNGGAGDTFGECDVASANTVRVRCFDAPSGAAADPLRFFLAVW
jgi:hypothetical protein